MIQSKPIYQEGMLAVCQSCGYTSNDFNYCQRCKRKLPIDCKSIPAADLDMASVFLYSQIDSNKLIY